MSTFRVAACALNQLALDFTGNLERIVRSIRMSQTEGACIRVGPELEISGYSCEDAFFEPDTCLHSWQVLSEILKQDFSDIVIDVGLCLTKDSCLYNCRAIIFNGKIVLIRPKTMLAGTGNYREDRWFTAWSGEKTVWFDLPDFITDITGQKRVPFGSDAILNLVSDGTSLRVGYEICEELWRPNATHIGLFLERGVHLVCNSSGSYWQIRKLDTVTSVIRNATGRIRGAYVWSNLVGCDGSRLCFSGRSVICVNGHLLACTSDRDQLFEEVQVTSADIDVQHIDSSRGLNYHRPNPVLGVGDIIDFDEEKGYEDSSCSNPLTKLTIRLDIERRSQRLQKKTMPVEMIHMTAPEELLYYGSLWLWDYLRRSGTMTGFIIPLSGGADSSSVTCLVYGMCHIVWHHLQHQEKVTPQIRKLLGFEKRIKDSFKRPEDLCRKLLLCVYLKTKYSGHESESRAEGLARLLGAQFKSHDVNPVYELMLESADPPLGGSKVSLREQNLQARLRMLHTYFFAGSRLVLSSGNVDEALVGYLTKYDCSSGDLNPIGSISKMDLRRFLEHCQSCFFPGNEVMESIITATPSAELTGSHQADEVDLKLTYKQLSLFGRFRKGEFGACGPFTMFCQLWDKRHELEEVSELSASQLAEKVKQFFTLHARNRHKTTVLTPALHAETYSPEDNRFDHRQFLFDTQWKWQFAQIDAKVNELSDG